MMRPNVTAIVHSPTPTGQPKLDSKITLPTIDGDPLDLRVVAKLWGRMGSADLLGIIVEEWNRPGGARSTLAWPLEPLSAVEREERRHEIERSRPDEITNCPKCGVELHAPSGHDPLKGGCVVCGWDTR